MNEKFRRLGHESLSSKFVFTLGTSLFLLSGEGDSLVFPINPLGVRRYVNKLLFRKDRRYIGRPITGVIGLPQLERRNQFTTVRTLHQT